MKTQILQTMKSWTDREWDALGDGHTMFNADYYTRPVKKDGFGLPLDFVKLYIREIESDGTPKGTIFDKDGKILDKVTGIYNLELVRGLVRLFSLEHPPCLGRGSEARKSSENIRAYVNLQS